MVRVFCSFSIQFILIERNLDSRKEAEDYLKRRRSILPVNYNSDSDSGETEEISIDNIIEPPIDEPETNNRNPLLAYDTGFSSNHGFLSNVCTKIICFHNYFMNIIVVSTYSEN